MPVVFAIMKSGLNQTSDFIAEFGVSNGGLRVLCHSYVRIVAPDAEARPIRVKGLESRVICMIIDEFLFLRRCRAVTA